MPGPSVRSVQFMSYAIVKTYTVHYNTQWMQVQECVRSIIHTADDGRIIHMQITCVGCCVCLCVESLNWSCANQSIEKIHGIANQFVVVAGASQSNI